MVKLQGKSYVVRAHDDRVWLSSFIGTINKQRSLLSRIRITEQCVRDLMLFFWFTWLTVPVEGTHFFEDVMPFSESGVLVPLPKDVHAFVTDVGFFPVLRGSQDDYRQAYLAYRWSP